MHYRNGRPALAGDKVFDLNTGKSGIVYGLSGSSDTCNGRLAEMSQSDCYLNLKDCVHADDVAAAFPPVSPPAQ